MLRLRLKTFCLYAIAVLVIPRRVEAPEPVYDTVLEHFKRRQVKDAEISLLRRISGVRNSPQL